jgi:integrase
VDAFGKDRLVGDLATEDFDRLRARLAKRLGPVSLGNEVQRIRVVFKHAYDAGLIDKPVRYGPTFKRPSKRVLRRHRQANGKKMFEAAEIRSLLAAASTQMKAMILLGINCGFGDHDCATLPISALDLDEGWVNFPRPKTAVERRCPLWPETVAAIKEAIAVRPKPKKPANADLVFITKYGQCWSKAESSDTPIANEFRKLTKQIDAGAEKEAEENGIKPPPKITRPRVGFYALRHSHETIGGDTGDQVAVDAIMGHTRDDMASLYREAISDERLKAVTNHVRQWLFGDVEGAGTASPDDQESQPSPD